MKRASALRLAGALAVLTIIGSVAKPTIIGLGEGQTFQMRQYNMEAIYTAVQIFAAEHGRYPFNVDEANKVFLRPGAKYLPEDRLLPSPYDGQQERLLPVVPPLGKASNPTSAQVSFESYENNLKPANWNHLGAILYDATPDGRHCVIYGISHKHAQIGIAPWYWNKVLFSGARVNTRTASASEVDASCLLNREELLARFRGSDIRHNTVSSIIAKPFPGLPFLYF